MDAINYHRALEKSLIVANRIVPTRYSDMNSVYYSPAWGLFTRIIPFIIIPYVKFFQYLGFLCLFVKQSNKQLNNRETIIKKMTTMNDLDMHSDENNTLNK